MISAAKSASTFAGSRSKGGDLVSDNNMKNMFLFSLKT